MYKSHLADIIIVIIFSYEVYIDQYNDNNHIRVDNLKYYITFIYTF